MTAWCLYYSTYYKLYPIQPRFLHSALGPPAQEGHEKDPPDQGGQKNLFMFSLIGISHMVVKQFHKTTISDLSIG